MSKRNTLNDLEEFLKLQASTLVQPQLVEPPRTTVQPNLEGIPETIKPKEVYTPPGTGAIQPVDLLNEMKKMVAQNKSAFYDFIIRTAESIPYNTKDVLLINTALYLKHGENWKEGIEEYWKKRKVNR